MMKLHFEYSDCERTLISFHDMNFQKFWTSFVYKVRRIFLMVCQTQTTTLCSQLKFQQRFQNRETAVHFHESPIHFLY